MDPKQPEQNKEMQNQDNGQQEQENMQEQQQVNEQEQQDNQQEGEGQIQGRVQEGEDDGGQGQDQQEQENQQEQRAQQNQQKQVQQRQQMINQQNNQIKEVPRQILVPETKNPIEPQQNQALEQKKQKLNPVIQKQLTVVQLPPLKTNQESKNISQHKPVSNPQQHIIRPDIKNVETVPAINSITQAQRQKYMNSLENNLKQRQLNIRLLSSKSEQQSIKISALEQKNKEISQQFQQLNKSNKQIETNFKIKQKLLQESVVKVQNLEKELVSYREIGDIRILLRRVQELEGLVKAQKNQISIIKSDGQQKIINESRQIPQRRYLAKEYIQKMEQLQNQKDQLQTEIKQLNYKIQNKNQQNIQIHEIMNKMDNALKNNIERMSGMQEQLQKKQKVHQTEKHNLEQKIKILQKFIEIQTAKRTNNKILGEQQMQQQNNTNLEKERQKNILFRQYLTLELDHQTLEEAAKDYKTKYLQACKQLQRVKKQMVTKKDYEQVLLRYKKCKLCLQKSIKQNKRLRNNATQIQMTQAQNPETKNNTALTQQQNTMKRYMEVLNQHMATAIDLSKQTNKITSDTHINRLKDQIKVKDKTIQELEQKSQKLQRWNNLFQSQLKYKNSLVDRLIEDGRNLTAQHNKVQKQRLALLGQLADNVTAKSSLNRLQSKSSALIIRNRKVINERDQWKSLYQQTKTKYQSFIARDPVQPQQQEKPNKNIIENNEKMMEQGEIFQQKTQQRRTAKPKNLLTSQTQTQGLNQLYYKQIKETLSALKKFPELIKKTTTDYQKVGKDLEQYKKKYDQVNLKYNMKFRELQNQKNENDLWRENAKKQLVNEFQDIRDLVQNQRLIVCLRKAKSLIEYLEQGQEEEEGQAAPQ